MSSRCRSDAQIRQILRGLVRRKGPPPPQGVQHEEEGAAAPSRAAGGIGRKKRPSAETIGEVAALFIQGRREDDPASYVARELTALFGGIQTRALGPQHLAAIVGGWRERYARYTVHVRLKALRRIVRDLGQFLANARLHENVPRMKEPPPRKRVVSSEEKEKLLAASPAWLRLFIHLTADLALRFASAKSVRVADYNRDTATVSFEIKGGTRQELPVTVEVQRIIDTIPRTVSGDTALIEALAARPISKDIIRRAWKRARLKAGIVADLTPHSFRRTAATNLWKLTRDLRIVQQLLGHASMHTTVRYIADEKPETLRPLLEQLKPHTEQIQ